MSFPPRPPIGMPPMMPQGYGYGPMPGMPMPMPGMPRMMPPMMRPSSMSNVPITSANSTTNRNSKKLVPQEIPKKDDADEKPPVTTVFVGNISERAPDAMIRQMLQRCGNVLSWKRVQGASGKLQAFGFCEYEDPEATLRCIRLLNEWQIAEKCLVVKVDAKTKALLDDYKKKKRQKLGLVKKKDDKDDAKEDSEKEQGEIDDEDRPSDDDEDEEEEHLDEFCQREDRVAKAGLDAIMREYSEDLAKVPPPEISAEEKREKRREKREKEKTDRESGLDDMELEGEKLDLINREIRSFRDAHKEDEHKTRELDRERELELRRRREEEWRREKERERERAEREREKERELRREKERERERREREREYSRRSRSRSWERERERDRGHSLSRERDRDRDRLIEDEEEVYERRKIERRIREKEAAYQELLKEWEARERKRARDYEKEKEREEDRKEEEAVEARRLKKFLEDYDDEQDDPKYYKGSALQRRLKEREKEMELDERDRQREKEELEEIRKKLEEESHPDIEAEMARIEKERDEHLMPRLNLSPEHTQVAEVHSDRESTPEFVHHEPEPVRHQEQNFSLPPHVPVQLPMKPLVEATMSTPSQSSEASESDNDNDNTGIVIPPVTSEDSVSMSHSQSQFSQSESLPGLPSRDENQPTRIGFSGLKLGGSESPEPQKRKKMTVGEVFNQDEEEEAPMKKHRLIPLVYSDEEKAAIITPSKPTTAEEKRKCIKNLIEKIPTGKNELFAFKLDWTMVDQMLMDRRIKPWVNKKIVEYIGEEEPTLTEFICQKVMANSTPATILHDVAMVLDEEAEVFVVKMWRLLIYETEAKKLGLVK